MTATARYFHQGPALWPFYGKAIIPKGARPGKTIGPLPDLSSELLGISTLDARLRSYRKLCGYATHSWVPATWPHILAFPLHMRLLTDPDFPLPLLGLVHLRNRIIQHRTIHEGECLDLRCHLSEGETTERGFEFDIVTDAFSGGQLIWQEWSTNLYRQPTEEKSDAGKRKKPSLERYPQTQYLEVPANTGRQYGRLSGDFNPIHMHMLSARLFGFPRAIAHGMWSKARCLAILEQQARWRPGTMEISTAFKKPLFLPGAAQLNWREGEKTWPFQLLNAKGDAPHLTGEVRFPD